MYSDALKTSANSAGELQRQQDIYMESTEAHLQKLRTEAERTYDILFDTDSVNSMTTALTKLMSLLNGYLTSFGGGLKSISGLALTIGNVFSNQIGSGLARTTQNIQEQAHNKDAAALKQEIIDSYQQAGKKVSDSTLDYEVQSTLQLFEIQKMLSEQEQKDYIKRQKEIAQLEERISAVTQYKEIAEELKKEGLMSFEGDVGGTDFEQAIENTSNKIEQLERDRRYFTGEYDGITLEDVQKKKADYETKWRNEHGGTKRGMHNKADWQELLSQEEALKKPRQEGIKQLDIFSDRRTQLLKQYKEELELKRQSVEFTEQDLQAYDSITKSLEGWTMTEEDRNNILAYQTTQIEQQQTALSQINLGAQGFADAERNVTPQLMQNVDQMKKYQQATYAAKIEQQQLTDSVKGLTAIGSVLMTITGTISALGDEAATTEQKITALLTGLLSTGVMILANWKSIVSIGPGLIVMLNSATLALGGSTVGVTTLTGAIGALWTALVPFLPIILAVGAAIAAVTVGVVSLIKQ